MIGTIRTADTIGDRGKCSWSRWRTTTGRSRPPRRSPQPIFQNPAAPFINSLVNGTSGISGQVAYATHYINAGAGVHPSEPNYIWAEAGDNLGVFNDDNPYHADCTPDTVQTTDQHLSAFLTKARRTWRSYQEDTDVDATNVAAAEERVDRSAASASSGLFTAPGINAYNYSAQYNYAAKHNPMVFFTDTNGGCNTPPPIRCGSSTRRCSSSRSICRAIAWPTTTGSRRTSTTTAHRRSRTATAASPASNDGTEDRAGRQLPGAGSCRSSWRPRRTRIDGVIVLWWDESEGGDTPAFTLPFIVISKDARAERRRQAVREQRRAVALLVRCARCRKCSTWIRSSGFPWLGAAASANDLSALFRPGTIR